MASLSEHLLECGSHARLPFHPDCPVCRAERLAGELPRPELLGRKAQAGVLAAALAATGTAFPAGAIAGTAKPPAVQASPGDPLGDSAADEDDLPGAHSPSALEGLAREPELNQLDPSPGTGSEDAPEVGADSVEEEPVDSLEEEPVDADVLPEEPAPAVPPEESSVPAPSESQPSSDGKSSNDGGPSGGRRAARDETQQKRGSEAAGSVATPPSPRSDAAGSVATPPPARFDALSAASAQLATAVAPAPGAAAAAHDSGRAGDRFHVVQPGETLWSIARDLLGHDATNAQIARDVERLWRLNADAIGSGDPDVIVPSQKLRLR